jgi:hypothetical protein
MQPFDHARDRASIVGIIGIAHDINIGLDVREHAAHDKALALPRLAPDDRSRVRRDLRCAIIAIVVIDIDARSGQMLAKRPHRFCNRQCLIVGRQQNHHIDPVEVEWDRYREYFGDGHIWHKAFSNRVNQVIAEYQAKIRLSDRLRGDQPAQHKPFH